MRTDILILVSAFLISACAGLASLLRSGSPLGGMRILSATLNSGLLGLGICLVWYSRFQDNLYFLVGVCVMAGLGGMATVEYTLAALRKGWLHVLTGSRDEDKDGKLP